MDKYEPYFFTTLDDNFADRELKRLYQQGYVLVAAVPRGTIGGNLPGGVEGDMVQLFNVKYILHRKIS